MSDVIYLESMDSVRATRLSEDDEKASAYAQAFVESLLNLAMGRNVVVQRSFAFDSLVFQRVLSDLVEAYASFAETALVETDRSAPFLLHLHGAPSFQQVVADAVLRISGAPSNSAHAPSASAPFQSSMYSDLRDQPGLDGVAAEIADGKPDRFLALLDPERALLFQRLWTWFGSSRAAGSPSEKHKIVSANGRVRHGIKELVEPLLDGSGSFSTDLKVLGIADTETVAGILSSLRTLRDNADGAGADAFTYRSRLFGDHAWYQTGVTAEEIVGVRNLSSVRELINTMYNMVCRDSIGIAVGSFTTEMVDPYFLQEGFTAQALAGLAYDNVTGRGLWHDAVRIGAPGVDVLIEGTSRKARTALIDTIGKTQRQAALRRVLEMREEKAWQATLAQLRLARSRMDTRAIDTAMRRHLDVVARGLAEVCEVDTTGGRLKTVLSLVAPAGATLDIVGTIHDGHKYNATELANNLATGMPGVMSALSSHRNRHVLRRSLGEIVTAAGVRD